MLIVNKMESLVRAGFLQNCLCPSQEGTNQSDWMFIKRQLLLSLPSHMRKLFSTRDAKTKKQALNMFELQLIELYEEMTGIRLELINE